MALDNGDMALFELTGAITGTNQIFETSSEEIAKVNKLFNPKEKYGTRLIVIGKNMVFKKIEDALAGLKPGEEQKIALTCDEAFGKRAQNLVHVMPIREFRDRDVNPVPNSYVNIDNRLARIVSANSGRVVLDFNHPLAGSDVTYTVKLVKTVSSPKEKVETLSQHYGIQCDAQVENDKVKITARGLNNDITYHGRKKTLVDALFVFLDMKSVAFSEEYERPKSLEPEKPKPAEQENPEKQ